MGDLRFVGGLAQGLGEGIERSRVRSQQQDQLDLLKKKMDIENKINQAKLDKIAENPDAIDYMMGIKKPPDEGTELDRVIAQAIKEQMQGISPTSYGTGTGSASLPQNIAPMAKYAAEYHGIPLDIAQALIQVESGGNPATPPSPKGAIGLTQLMPKTAQDLGVNPQDPYQNMMGGMRYLAEQKQRFGEWPKALAAYNTGPETVATKGVTPEGQAYLGKVSDVMRPKQAQAGQSSMIGGLTADDFVRGYIKKKYGAEADEWSPMKGVAGPGGKPYVVPFNKRTRQFDWSAATAESIEPKLITQTGPMGEEQQIAIDPFEVNTIQTKSGGKKPEEAGKTGVIAGGISALNEAEPLMFGKNGEVKWENILKANAPMGGIGEGRTIRAKYAQAIRGVLRPESGALISPSEIEDAVKTYLPGPGDYALGGKNADNLAREKFGDFKMLLENLSKMTNPDDQLRLVRSWVRIVEPGGQPKTRMQYDPATGTFK